MISPKQFREGMEKLKRINPTATIKRVYSGRHSRSLQAGIHS